LHPEKSAMSKRLLIVTYYWPPSGGSGVQRWLKFCKYLEPLGWEITVLTPENPSFALRDESLVNDVPAQVEVLKLPIWEPYQLYLKIGKLVGLSAAQPTDFVATGRKSIFATLSAWVRGNFFIPDARIFWVRPAVDFIQSWLNREQSPILITTGPPHSIHVIGLRLKKKLPTLRWVADFRDPWSEWDLLDALQISHWARARHQRLERQVLRLADRVITIAPFHQQRFQELGGRAVDLITNGFDPDDFKSITRKRTSRFTIRHVGMVDELRDPRPFLTAVKQLMVEAPDFESDVLIEFVGNVNSAFKLEVQQDARLREVVQFRDAIPHQQLLQTYGETDLQLLVLAHTALAPGNLPGKFFEYLASGNPILAIGPTQGDAQQVLADTNSGRIFERTDVAGIQSAIAAYYQQWQTGDIAVDRQANKYARPELARQLDTLLQSLL
jgi:glycosyltransferase involved in cell wall biosynthesis